MKITILKISIHNEKDNPIFGEGAIHLEIEDEAAGGFFCITSNDGNKIKLNPEELYLLAEEGKKIIQAYED